MFSKLKRSSTLGLLVLTGLVCLATGWGLRTAVGEVTPPTADKGISRETGPDVDLGPELPGYRMHMNVVTFAPGAIRAIHDHKQNPEAAYVLEGTLTEYRKGSAPQEFKAGQMRGNGREVEHWIENHGTGKAVQVSVVVVKAK